MATLQERKGSDGKTVYRVQVRLKGHPPESATFERKTDAKRWAQQIESAIREGRYFVTAEARRHTLAELLDRYVRDVLPRKGTQRNNQRTQLNWWRKQLGPYVLADVTPARVAECRDRLLNEATPQGTQRSPSTVNRYMAALSHAFSVAVDEWGWLNDSPMRKVRKPPEPRGRVRFLSDDDQGGDGSLLKGERTRLLEACRISSNPYLHTVVVLALSTGMRKGEIMRLTWRDVDLKQDRVTLHQTKNGERRVVPLAGRVLELVKEHTKVRRLDTDLLFPSNADPKRPMDLRFSWLEALRAAQIEDFRFHDLRHSCASYLAMNGASLAEIAEVLGHKTLAMVKRYAHLSEAHTAGVVERMNERFLGNKNG